MPTDTARRLTDAAILAIREHGYAGTSMQDLLRDTGVSSSSMYHHFPGGKEALVAEAVRRSGFDSAELIAAVMDRDDPADGIRLIFEAGAREMRSHDFTLGCPIGVPATEAPTDSEAIRAAVAEVFDAWTDIYRAALERHGVDDHDAAELARAIVAVYQGTVTLARATRSIQPYDDAITLLTNQLRVASTSQPTNRSTTR